jgi:Flp pilus assembly protein TadG
MNKKKQHSGQTLIEFALLFPVFLILIFGFFDLGRAVFYYSSLTNAVRETARYAIVHHDRTEDTLRNMVLDKYAFAIDQNDIIIAIEYFAKDDLTTPVGSDTDGITNFAIRATYTFDPVTPFIERIDCCGGITLVAESTMRISSAFR